MALLSGKYIRGMHSQRGFTLIEALIAFVILSVGLLGIVSLQAVAKSSQQLALQHTRAVTIADAIVERIRVNPAAVEDYNIGTDNPVGETATAEPTPNCRSAACTPAELAAHDLWAWEQALLGAGAQLSGTNTAGLIEPRGCIVFTATTDQGKNGEPRDRAGQLTVIIQWRGLKESFDAVQGGEVTCGGEDAGDDDFRRQVIVTTYIVDEEQF